MDLLFVSLSDMHLGDEYSILTNLAVGKKQGLTASPGPIVESLVNFLHAVKRRVNEDRRIPFLVLNGDILELATRTIPFSTAFYRLFLEAVGSRKLFDRVVYIPGNHDHGLWTLMVNSNFAESVGKNSPARGSWEYAPVTSLSTARDSHVLTMLSANIPMGGENVRHLTANPAFRLRSRLGHDFLFHHGHYLENLYQALTIILKRLFSNVTINELTSKPAAKNLTELELDNRAWLDFVWSGLTKEGGVGRPAYGLYNLLKQDPAENPDIFETLKKRLVKILDQELDIRRILGDSVSSRVLELIDDDIIGKLVSLAMEHNGIGSKERGDGRRPPFSDDLKHMCLQFLTHYMRVELEAEGYRPARDRTTFVFGHTHKPFVDNLTGVDKGFGNVRVINSGGWVVEEPEGDNKPYGPGIVLGANDGSSGLIPFSFGEDSEYPMELEGSWDRTLELLPERAELMKTIRAGAELRKDYLKEESSVILNVLKG